MTSLLLSIAVIAAFALIGGGLFIVAKRPGDRRRGVLMLLAGIVTLINVVLFATMPPFPS